jgi:hypothetical protein
MILVDIALLMPSLLGGRMKPGDTGLHGNPAGGEDDAAFLVRKKTPMALWLISFDNSRQGARTVPLGIHSFGATVSDRKAQTPGQATAPFGVACRDSGYRLDKSVLFAFACDHANGRHLRSGNVCGGLWIECATSTQGSRNEVRINAPARNAPRHQGRETRATHGSGRASAQLHG